MSSFASIKNNVLKFIKSLWSDLTGLDKVALFVSLLLLFLLCWILITDRALFFTGAGTSLGKKGLPIAVLESAEETVKHKSAQLPGWNSIRTNEKLYQRDKIFTDQGSSAVIRLGNDSILRLGENTLVVIGIAEADRNQKSQPIVVDIEVSGKLTRVKADKADFKIQAQPNGTVSVVVDSGKAELTSSSGEHSTVGKQQKAQVDLSGSLGETKTIKIEPIEPKDGRTFRISMSNEQSESRKIEFQWRSQLLGMNYRLEIAKDLSFNSTVHQSNWRGEKGAWALDGVEAGVYHWRVAALDTSGQVVDFGEPRKFVVREITVPRLVWPSQNQVITLTQNPGRGVEESALTGQLLFEWQSKFPDGDYEFQLATNREFQDVLLHDLNAVSPMNSKDLTQGRYFWRVRQKFDAKEFSPWSDTSSFLLRLNQELVQVQKLTKKVTKLDPPKLKERYKVRIKKYPIKLNFHGLRPIRKWYERFNQMLFPVAVANPSATLMGDESIDGLAWDKVTGATGYALEIAKDSDFKTPVIRTELTQPSYSIEALQVGHYYFRVAAIDENGQQSEFSRISELEVQPPIPDLLTPVNGSTIPQKDAIAGVQFSWDEIPGDSTYILEFSKQPEFKTIWQRKEVNSSAIQIALDRDGIYYWRVATKSLISGDRLPLEFTPGRKLTVLPEPKPPKPEVLSPLITTSPMPVQVPKVAAPLPPKPQNNPALTKKPIAPPLATKPKAKEAPKMPKVDREAEYNLWRATFAWFNYGFGDGNYWAQFGAINRSFHTSVDQVWGFGLEIPFLDHWRANAQMTTKTYVMHINQGVIPPVSDTTGQTTEAPVQYQPMELTFETIYLSAKYDWIFLRYFALVAEGGLISNTVPFLGFASNIETTRLRNSIYGLAPSLGLMLSYSLLRFEMGARFVQEMKASHYGLEEYANDLYHMRLLINPYKFLVLGIAYESEENYLTFGMENGFVSVSEQSDIVKIYLGGKF